MSGRRLSVRAETWPIEGSFTISRGSRTESRVVVAEIADGDHIGRGECLPYARYDETVEGVAALIESVGPAIADGIDRAGLQDHLPPGAARNALDCALWDLEAKRTGTPVWRRAGLAEPGPPVTAYTLSLGTVEAMGAAARANARRPLLKVKLGSEDIVERVRAVRAGAPETRLVVDANEAWTPALLTEALPELARLGVEMVEQPLPAGADDALAGIDRSVAVCADESCHDTASLAGLAGRYDMINIKLDKTGGLTEALRLAAAGRAAGLEIMLGCNLGTSLAMAPAMLLTNGARMVDLDGPLLLTKDRKPGLRFEGSLIHPPETALWG